MKRRTLKETNHRLTREEQRAITRKSILDVAKVAFEHAGYENTDLRSLAADIGRSTGAIFCNFDSKAAVYVAVYGHPPITVFNARELAKALAFLAIKEGSSPAGNFARGTLENMGLKPAQFPPMTACTACNGAGQTQPNLGAGVHADPKECDACEGLGLI
jgi:hypothetical protein